jgi:acyl-CoA thioesterase I
LTWLGRRLRLRQKLSRVFSATAIAAYVLFAVCIRPAEADPHVPVIVAFGDSFTAGLGISHERAFPAQLEAWLRSQGKETRVVNAGKSGDTTAAAMPRLDKALAEKPDLVILELGANDALRGVDPAITRANLATMITRIEATGAKLLLTGILAPPNWGEEYRLGFNRLYPELARTHQVPLYPFFLQGVALDPQLIQADGLHPNERGVEALVNRIGPIVVRLLPGQPEPAAPR